MGPVVGRGRRQIFSELAGKQCQLCIIRLDEESINYFKAISEQVGIPYQSLINLYLRDCAASQRKLNLNWKEACALLCAKSQSAWYGVSPHPSPLPTEWGEGIVLRDNP